MGNHGAAGGILRTQAFQLFKFRLKISPLPTPASSCLWLLQCPYDASQFYTPIHYSGLGILSDLGDKYEVPTLGICHHSSLFWMWSLKIRMKYIWNVRYGSMVFSITDFKYICILTAILLMYISFGPVDSTFSLAVIAKINDSSVCHLIVNNVIS